MVFLRNIHNSIQNIMNRSRDKKNPSPRYWCDWPWTTLVILCDGMVVCGCADPRGLRPVGNVRHQRLKDIWHGKTMDTIRQGLIEGHAFPCRNCGLKITVEKQQPKPPPLPSGPIRLFIEPTIHCNISCYNSHCNRESGIIRTREQGVMTLELFTRIVDQASDTLQRLELFNYGEPFLNKKLPEMITYVRDKYPSVFTFTSTNGLVWNNDKQIEEVIKSGLHELVFSVDGPTSEIYQQYRIGGNFEKAITNMKRMVDRREHLQSRYPIVTFRYILFRWNDSDEIMDLTRKLARDIGVDRLCWELTDHPEGCPSKRFIPGTPDFNKIKHEIWDIGANANALTEKIPQASIKTNFSELVVRNGSPLRFHVKIQNLGQELWFATAPDNLRFVTLGIQLHNEHKNCIDRDFYRKLLPNNIHPEQEIDVEIEFVLNNKGRYWLKLDMVLEGYGWFESGGSRVNWLSVVVTE